MTICSLSLAILMLFAGAMHFIKTDFYLQIMPGYLPAPRMLVLVSGAAAMLCGALMFYEPARKLGVWGAILYFIAVFPANLYMALHPEVFPAIPLWLRWGRLPLQGVLIYWAYRCF